MRYRFIEEHRQEYPVSLMCRVLGVSRSGYYAWRTRPASPREMANQQLLQEIRTIYAQSRGTYGSPRIHAQLRQQGIRCGRNRVARLMRRHGIRAQQKPRYRRTTDSDHNLPVAPNLLDRDFTAEAPDQKWMADLSYVATGEGWLYVAVIIDLYARTVVGWAMGSRLDRHLPMRALQMALEQRQPAPGLIHHSDRGSQYASDDYQALLAQHGLQPSMSRRGNCYDSAPVESFFATLKGECVHRYLFATRAEARSCLFEYMEVFYNRYRLHSALGYLSPEAYEQQAADP